MYVPVAVNCCDVLSATAGLSGVTVIPTSAGANTVSVTDFVTEPEVASIVVGPWRRPVANPWLPAALLIVATAVAEELQVVVAVMFCVLPSVNVPVAVNCCVTPWAIEAEAGLMAIETSAAGVTLSEVTPLTGPSVAVMLADPCATAVASPLLPVVLLIVAVDEELVHVTCVVRFCVLPSE